jgi:hypothetical protein
MASYQKLDGMINPAASRCSGNTEERLTINYIINAMRQHGLISGQPGVIP